MGLILPQAAGGSCPPMPNVKPAKGEAVPDKDQSYIMNPYYGKEFLTKFEALNAINMLSGMVLIDGGLRRAGKSPNKHE